MCLQLQNSSSLHVVFKCQLTKASLSEYIQPGRRETKEQGEKLVIFCSFSLKLCTLGMFGYCNAGCSTSSKGCLLPLSHGIEEGAVTVPDDCWEESLEV